MGSKVDPWEWRSRTTCEAENNYGQIPQACLEVVSLEVEDEWLLNFENIKNWHCDVLLPNVVEVPNDLTGPTMHEHDGQD